MNKEDFMTLVNNKLLTEVGMVDHYMDNPEALDKLTVNELSATGAIPQPKVNEFLKDNPISSADGMSKEEFLDLIAKGGVINLVNSIDLGDTCAIVNCDVTVKLNGYSIKGGLFNTDSGTVEEGDTDSYVFWVKKGVLTIEGDGTVEALAAKYSMAVWADGGTVNINGGKYYNAGEGADLIYVKNAGVVNIYAGEFKACEHQEGVAGTKEKYSVLNSNDKSKGTFNVCGGRFFGFNPADNLSENPPVNFVNPEFHVEKDGDWFVVLPGAPVVDDSSDDAPVVDDENTEE